MTQIETVEQYLARGGVITQGPTLGSDYDLRKAFEAPQPESLALSESECRIARGDFPKRKR